MEKQQMLAAALAYGRKGWAVFPCAPDKTPLTSRGFKDATTDADQIAAWWTRSPEAWIGRATGGGSFVVDIDPRHGGGATLAAWEAENGALPYTVEARTPSGGSHLYFAVPEGINVRSGAGVIGPGVDVRGEGGYVIVPPSPGYQWVENGGGLENAPEALLRSLRTSTSYGRGPAAPLPEKIRLGDRNSQLTSVAGSLRRRRAAEAEIVEALRVINQKRCEPPLEDEEVQRIARSVARYEPAASSSDGPSGSGSPGGTESHRSSPWAAARPVQVFLDACDPEADFLEPKLLARGSITEFFSPRGLGKTHVAHAIAVRQARAGVRVLLIDRDNSPRETRRRLRGWGADGLVSLDVLTRDRAPSLTDARAWAMFPTDDYDIVIIDSLDSSAEGVGEQDSARPSKALASILDVARKERGPAILVLGNVVKSGAHSRGSGVVEDRADLVYEVRDATGFAPSGSKPWFQELPASGAAEWQERAARRGRKDLYRLAFVSTKFRLGEEPEPFILEVDLSGDAWTLRDVTSEVDEAGREARERKESSAIARLRQAIAETKEPLVAQRDGVPILQEAGLTREAARAVLQREDGQSWVLREDLTRRGRPKLLETIDRAAEDIRGAKANTLSGLHEASSADRMDTGRQKTCPPEALPLASIVTQSFSAAPPNSPEPGSACLPRRESYTPSA